MGELTQTLATAAATHKLGVEFGRSLGAGSVLLLQGDLGSGKTTFVQGLGAGLGITDAIASPTFALIHEYPEGRVPLYHFDLYRLTPAETASLTPELYWEGTEVPPGIVAIEWAERLPYQPSQYLQITFTHQADGSRQVQFRPVGEIGIEIQSLYERISVSH